MLLVSTMKSFVQLQKPCLLCCTRRTCGWVVCYLQAFVNLHRRLQKQWRKLCEMPGSRISFEEGAHFAICAARFFGSLGPLAPPLEAIVPICIRGRLQESHLCEVSLCAACQRCVEGSMGMRHPPESTWNSQRFESLVLMDPIHSSSIHPPLFSSCLSCR